MKHIFSFFKRKSQISPPSIDINREKDEIFIFNHLNAGILIIDTMGKIKQCNRAFSKFLKKDPEELVGLSISSLPEEWSKKMQPLLQKCLDEGMLKRDILQIDKTHLELFFSPLPSKEGALFITHDNSCHHKIHEMGKDFIANASHELRTPITIIKGFAETLKDLPEISGAMLEDIMEKILRNCERMDILVKNLLLLADLDYLPRARLQPCDPYFIIDNSCEHLLSLYPDTEISLIGDQDASLKVLADPDLLELALLNILQNAVKYSKSPAKIKIQIEVEVEKIHVSISDQGIGIPEEKLYHIFDRFYTVDKAHSRKLGGAGLGLSIVKNIIDKHCGTISASSKIGMGTTFTISLLRKTATNV